MNSKRQTLVDTALNLFYEHGINSIGINQILKVSGIAKKTLYHHFDSKDALVLATLEQRNHSFNEWLKHRLNHSKTNSEVISNLFHALQDWFSDKAPELGKFRGCFFINTSAEFSDPSSDISKYCQYHKQQVRNIVAQYLFNPTEDLLDAICILKEGAISMAYVANDLSAPKKCIQLLNKF
ncbi:TetR/AcrR family transcriptional regulator [Kangiella shandongensis]|uniref:TetR/AcrR family transcriptional regulator n=1 Tax=Kangiella shandongensis TaxID=2763258 RepID=UPI001CBD8A43|nr:TetR/AcrR family transcriptional regulator [Kangiella shandongensis]